MNVVYSSKNKTLDSRKKDAMLLIWWMDAAGDDQPFHPQCDKGHAWTTACENAKHKAYTVVVTRDTVLAIDLERDSSHCLTAESLKTVHSQVQEHHNKRHGKTSASSSQAIEFASQYLGGSTTAFATATVTTASTTSTVTGDITSQVTKATIPASSKSGTYSRKRKNLTSEVHSTPEQAADEVHPAPRVTSARQIAIAAGKQRNPALPDVLSDSSLSDSSTSRVARSTSRQRLRVGHLGSQHRR